MEHSWCNLTNQLVQVQFGLADTGCSGVAFFLPVKVCDQSACFTRGSLEAWGKILVCRVVNGLEGPTRCSRDRQVKQSGPDQTMERHSGDITWPIFGSLVPYQLWILIGSDGKASKQATACQLAVELRQLLGRRTDPAVEDLHRPDPTGCAAQYHSEARVGSSQHFLEGPTWSLWKPNRTPQNQIFLLIHGPPNKHKYISHQVVEQDIRSVAVKPGDGRPKGAQDDFDMFDDFSWWKLHVSWLRWFSGL